MSNGKDLVELLSPYQVQINSFIDNLNHYNNIQAGQDDVSDIPTPDFYTQTPAQPDFTPYPVAQTTTTSIFQVPTTPDLHTQTTAQPYLSPYPVAQPSSFFQVPTTPDLYTQAPAQPDFPPYPVTQPTTCFQVTTTPADPKYSPNPVNHPTTPTITPTQPYPVKSTPLFPPLPSSSGQVCENCGILDQMVKKFNKDPQKSKGGRPTKEKLLREAFNFSSVWTISLTP